MKVCPYCGQPLDEKLDRCNKCGAILSLKGESDAIRCSKCGGILKGMETHCPWCGFPCSPTYVSKDSEAYHILKTLENALRQFIQQALSSVDSKWWETRIPEDVRTEANHRKIRDEKLHPWHVQKDLPPIYYIDFSDYAKIIAFEKNWNQIFKETFKDKYIIVTKLKELEPIRRAIAHMRDVSEKDLQKLKLYSEEIISCISLTSKFFAEVLHYGEVMANMDVDYGILRIRYSATDPDFLQMEFERGRIGDVVRPKPIIGMIKFPPQDRFIIEESIRHLLQVIARDEWAEMGMAILQIGKLDDIINKIGRLMYEIFPKPIKQQLAGMPSGSLLALALEDKVLGLPWELAYDGTDFLAVKFGIGRIIYHNGIPSRRRRSKPETRILLVSNPDGSLSSDVKVAILIEEKLRKIGAIVDHFNIEGEDHFYTSKNNLLSAFESGLYDVIHFMGHSYYNPKHPEKSSFVVADGYISAEDITKALDKTIKFGKEPPSLFYAHSCEAAAQRSWDLKSYESQILGLSTAFLLHNVSYIGAVWTAKGRTDKIMGADKLALAFYEEFLDRKQPLGLALRNAKLSLKKEGDPNCEWANFVLYGDPSITIKI